MPRPAIPLQAIYGKLRVLEERRDKGRRIVKVQCTCNNTKEVYADQLLSGRSRSCGSIACKSHATKANPVYRPSGVRVITLERLKKYWTLHTEQRFSGVKIAEMYAENRHTLYSAFRAIRLAGGWDKYEAKVKK